MHRLLVTLLRKLCSIVRPILNWSSHSCVARLLNRLWSFILRASRTSGPRSSPNDPGVPTPAILLPSATASVTSCTPAHSPREIEEDSPRPTVDRISTQDPPQADLSLRADGNNDGERELQLIGPRPSPGTYFVPIIPSQSGRYKQNIIMCVVRSLTFDTADLTWSSRPKENTLKEIPPITMKFDGECVAFPLSFSNELG